MENLVSSTFFLIRRRPTNASLTKGTRCSKRRAISAWPQATPNNKTSTKLTFTALNFTMETKHFISTIMKLLMIRHIIRETKAGLLELQSTHGRQSLTQLRWERSHLTFSRWKGRIESIEGNSSWSRCILFARKMILGRSFSSCLSKWDSSTRT